MDDEVITAASADAGGDGLIHRPTILVPQLRGRERDMS